MEVVVGIWNAWKMTANVFCADNYQNAVTEMQDFNWNPSISSHKAQ
jgi:hypothetical protein